MSAYKTPGVYVAEASTRPPAVAGATTAIPAFIGYTEKSPVAANQPVKISTFLDYKNHFGGPEKATYKVTITGETVTNIDETTSNYQMYYCLDLYFKNGGGSCYIVSAGTYKTQGISVLKTDLEVGLHALEKKDEPTLIVFTEAVNLNNSAMYYNLCDQVLAQCHKLGNRFGILDVLSDDADATDFRQGITTETEYLKYGAAYYPYVQTSISHLYNESEVKIESEKLAGCQTSKNGINVVYTGDIATNIPKVTFTLNVEASSDFDVTKSLLTVKLPVNGAPAVKVKTAWDKWKRGKATFGYEISLAGDGSERFVTATAAEPLRKDAVTLQGLKTGNTIIYNNVCKALNEKRVTLPPAAAMAGIYATTDRNKGVWKAPANINLAAVTAPAEEISAREQENLNVDAQQGKSINIIRQFSGKGTLVWGARTLAGNHNNWRYISVRRLFNTIEKYCKKATAFAVFEPNYIDTWIKVKSRIDSYLYGLWQKGALTGAVPEDAYFINVGLGKTMTSQDILDGRMIVEVGIAAVRPAEFIILRFSHKLQES